MGKDNYKGMTISELEILSGQKREEFNNKIHELCRTSPVYFVNATGNKINLYDETKKKEHLEIFNSLHEHIEEIAEIKNSIYKLYNKETEVEEYEGVSYITTITELIEKNKIAREFMGHLYNLITCSSTHTENIGFVTIDNLVSQEAKRAFGDYVERVNEISVLIEKLKNTLTL